jgi:DNA-binding SARP family transcriptional activator
MIVLRTLGSLDVRAVGAPSAPGVITQPKRFVLLVYLACVAPAFVRRDTLLALLWPDANQARGRSVLRQTIYLLRQALGANAIRSRGDEELGVDPAFVECDATRFAALLADGKLAAALELYRGDFLTGFHAPDCAPELEEWMQAEGRRLRALATDAAWSLAAAEAERGNVGGASHSARRVLALDPLNEHRLRDVMQLLARVGDRAGAVEAYEVYARRAREAFGVEPDVDLAGLAASLRAQSLGAAAAGTAGSPGVSGDGLVPPSTAQALGAAATSEERHGPPVRRRSVWVASLALAVLALVAGLWQRGTATARQSTGDVARPTEQITEVSTTSLVAYRLYQQGLKAFYEGEDWPAAHRLFKAALGEDSAFAMAAYYAGATTEGDARYALFGRALRLADRATDRERLLIAEGAAELGMSASASALADTVAIRYPHDAEAQFAYGHALTRRGDFLGEARQDRRVITMDSLGPQRTARCLACDAYGNLIWAYIYADSLRAAEEAAREYVRAKPSIKAYLGLHLVLAREGRSAEAMRALRSADSLRGGVDLELPAAILAIRDGAFADADARLERLRLDGASTTRELATWYLGLSLRAQGRFRDALRVADGQPQRVLRPLVELEMGDSKAASADFQTLVVVPDAKPPLPGHRAKHMAWMLTHVATSLAAARDTARLSALADSVQEMGSQSALGRDLRLHHYVRGLLWNARHNPARAASEFGQSIWSWSDGYTRANYELAHARIALDEPADAIYPLQTALRGDIESSNLYVSRTELHELLAQAFDQMGKRDSARVHYRAVVTAWSRCDSIFVPRVTAARARLVALTSR